MTKKIKDKISSLALKQFPVECDVNGLDEMFDGRFGARIGATPWAEQCEKFIPFLEWFTTVPHYEHCDLHDDEESDCTCGVTNAKELLDDFEKFLEVDHVE